MSVDPRTLPSWSTRLWSDEVGLADPEGDARLPGLGYRFSSGRSRSDDLAASLYAPRYANLVDPELYEVVAASADGDAVLAAVADLLEAAAADDLPDAAVLAAGAASVAEAATAGAAPDAAAARLAELAETALAGDDPDAVLSIAGADAQVEAVHAATAVDASLQAVAASAEAGSAVAAQDARGQFAPGHSAAAAASDSAHASTVRLAAGGGAATAAEASDAAVTASGAAAGATLYVAPTGNDSTNTGSAASPFATITRAASVARPGDVVQVASGSYTGGFVTSAAGLAGNPVTYRAAERGGARLVPPAAGRDMAWDNRGAYVVIDGFEVDASADTASLWRIGINNSGQGGIVQNCHVHHVFYQGTASSSGGAGIVLDPSAGGGDMHARGNTVHHCGPAATGTSWYHGIAHRTTGSVELNLVYGCHYAGITALNDATSTTVAKNTVFGNRVGVAAAAASLAGSDVLVVRDNILYDNLYAALDEQGSTAPANVYDNNLIYDTPQLGINNFTTSPAAASATNVLAAEPVFVNYQRDGSGDYRLAVGSPAIGAATDGTSLGALPSVALRSPLVWPFAASSIWNMPLGSGAVYVPSGLNGTPNNGNLYAHMPGVDTERICMTPAAPLTDIKYSSAGWTGGDRCTASNSTVLATVPMPAAFVVPNSNYNEGGVFLAADGRTVIQVQPLARCTAGAYATAQNRFADVDIYGAGASGGHGGSGLSSLGGSIRLGELRPGQSGPRHALKVNVYAKQFLYRGTTRAACYRWPATTCDSYAVGWYGTEGAGGPLAMKMGALLAIPPATDLAALGLETEPGRQLAWTLQNYGAYIVDDAYAAGFDFSFEEGAAGSKSAEFQADYGFAPEQRVTNGTPWVRDIQRLCNALYVVDNNGPTAIGGGGTPRQPLAPDFA